MMDRRVPCSTAVHPDGRILFTDEPLCEFEARLAEESTVAPVRQVFAAPHVAMLESYRDVYHSVAAPSAPEEIVLHVDFATTMRLRVDLDALGFGIAEAMDTAQRFSLGWVGAQLLIEECGRLDLAHGFVAGAGTDHLPSVEDRAALVDGVVYQSSVIRAAGGDVILLPMPQLCSWGCSAAEFVAVYRDILAQVEGPIYIHWLGEMFLPEVRGYFPADSFRRVMDLDPHKVRGAKLSLLDADLEIELRRHLAANDQIMLTGDDFHFASLIAGTGDAAEDGQYSHALLGIFDAIARPASIALQFLARGERSPYFTIMNAAEALSRVVFSEPTRFYKSGLAFLAWLDGRQDNRMLIQHEENARPVSYYAEVAQLASDAGVLRDAALAAERFEQFLVES